MTTADRELTWTQEPPTEPGWYFHATSTIDFDIAKPIQVQRIEEGSGRCWCRVMDDGHEFDVRSRHFAAHWWYGPIRVPTTLGEGA